MKGLLSAVCAAGLMGAAALPALADSHMDPATLTCGDYSAMSAEDQMAAMQAMQTASAGDAATGDAAAADTATTEMAADDPMMTAMMEACATDPAMMAMDAMNTATGTGTN
jgi:hypothetical protein